MNFFQKILIFFSTIFHIYIATVSLPIFYNYFEYLEDKVKLQKSNIELVNCSTDSQFIDATSFEEDYTSQNKELILSSYAYNLNNETSFKLLSDNSYLKAKEKNFKNKDLFFIFLRGPPKFV